MNLGVKASGRSKTQYGLALSPDFFTPKEPFCACVVSPLSQKKGSGDHLSFTQIEFCPSLSLP